MMKHLNIIIYLLRFIIAYPIFLLFYNFNKSLNLIHLSYESKEFFLLFCFIMTISQIIKFLIVVKINKDKIYDDDLAKYIKFKQK